MLGVLGVVLTAVTALGIWGAPALIRLFAYGFVDDPVRFDLAVFLLRVMFPFLIAVGLTALAMGILNTVKHFAAPALAPALLNVAIISTVVLASGSMAHYGLPSITALAVGVVVGGLFQVILPASSLDATWSSIRTALRL